MDAAQRPAGRLGGEARLMAEPVPTPVAALGMSISVDVAPGANLVFQTHLDRDSEIGEIDELVSKALSVGDRKRAEFEAIQTCSKIVTERGALRKNIEELTKLTAGHEARLAVVADRRNPERAARQTPQQIAQRNSFNANIDASRTAIARLERRLDMLRRIASGERTYLDLALAELEDVSPAKAVA